MNASDKNCASLDFCSTRTPLPIAKNTSPKIPTNFAIPFAHRSLVLHLATSLLAGRIFLLPSTDGSGPLLRKITPPPYAPSLYILDNANYRLSNNEVCDNIRKIRGVREIEYVTASMRVCVKRAIYMFFQLKQANKGKGYLNNRL